MKQDRVTCSILLSLSILAFPISLGVFVVRFGSVLGKKPINPNNKFYFDLVRFGLIIIEKPN